MRSLCLAMVLVVGLSGAVSAQGRYPLVYGPTGRPYGPTQAAYQYERQYGRPWHGYGGLTAPSHAISGHYTVTGYPFWGRIGPYLAAPAPGLAFYSPGYYGNFGVIYGTPPMYLPYPDHGLAQYPPTWSFPAMTEPLAAEMQKNQLQWGDSLPPVKPDPVERPVVPSSTEARLKSLEAQANGDQDLRNQKWLQAYIDYKKAVQLADDRADAHLRLGLTLIALQHYDSATVSLKRALKIDPSLPQSELTLEKLFGPGSELARSSIAHKLLDYVQDDIRNPDRLFLMGTLLHFNGDPHAREVLETGLRLAGGGHHFAVFLQPPSDTYTPKSAPTPASSNPKAANPEPPAPNLPPAPLPEPAAAIEQGPQLILP